MVPLAQILVPLEPPSFQNPPVGGEMFPITSPSIRKEIPVGSQFKPYVWKSVANEPLDSNLDGIMCIFVMHCSHMFWIKSKLI